MNASTGSWLCLLMAILFEVSGTASMKLSYGFTKTLPSVLIFVFYGCSFAFFTFAVKQLHLGVSYAIWSGLGTALAAVIGVYMFGETMTAIRLFFITLILIAVAGLHYTAEL